MARAAVYPGLTYVTLESINVLYPSEDPETISGVKPSECPMQTWIRRPSGNCTQLRWYLSTQAGGPCRPGPLDVSANSTFFLALTASL